MEEKRSFFHIQVEMLPKSVEIFPFHLYVYNQVNNSYSPYLYGNSPLIEEKKSFLKYIISKGAILAIPINQKRTFLNVCGLSESDIPDLARPKIHKLQIERDQYIKELEASPLPPLNFAKEINDAIKRNCFLPLIERVRKEVLTFKVTISHTVSLARYFARQLLIDDNNINRTVALTYLFAKQNNIDGYEPLSDIICSTFLHHIGVTQLDRAMILRPEVECRGQEKSDFQKHPGLAQHLIKKCKLELSSSSIDTILDHHERSSGSGYPYQKMERAIHPASLILGSISHIIDYASGRITGSKYNINDVLKKIQNHSIDAGLEFDFGDTISKNIENISRFTDELKRAA